MKREKISTNIFKDETYCKCGCDMGLNGDDVDTQKRVYELARNVQLVIDLIHLFTSSMMGIKMDDVVMSAKFTSWCRCYDHNKKEGGTPNSIHTTGGAVDFKLYRTIAGKTEQISPDLISLIVYNLSKMRVINIGGIGCYNNRNHIDTREDMVTWIKKNNGGYEYGTDFSEVSY